MVSVRKGWGTQRANPGPCSAKSASAYAQGTQHPVGHHWGLRRFVEPPVRARDQTPGEPTLGPCSARPMFVHAQGTLHQWATTRAAADAFGGATSARRGSSTQAANPGPYGTAVHLRPGGPAPSRPLLGL